MKLSDSDVHLIAGTLSGRKYYENTYRNPRIFLLILATCQMDRYQNGIHSVQRIQVELKKAIEEILSG